MSLRLLPFLCVLFIAQASLAQGSATTNPLDVPTSCPVTSPSDQPFVPPSPYPSRAPKGAFWFGTDELWTVLPASGTWGALPYYDRAFGQKLFFWRQGYDPRTEPEPHLKVTGKRLDAPAPSPIPEDASNCWQKPDQPFMVTGVNLPTLGCWEITGHYQGHELRFVVWVTK